MLARAPGCPAARRPRLVPPAGAASAAFHHRRPPPAAAGGAHIEFNAINLALDAVWRLPACREAFYLDWLRVAAEEALHFRLVRDHLLTLGRDYGDFDAHDGLWTMAWRDRATTTTARMAWCRAR